jgi:hypothetical protein
MSRHEVTPEQVYSHGTFALGHGESPNAQEQEEEVGKALLPGELAIPVGHTTGAVRVLMWPAVQNLIREKLKEEEVTDLELYIEYPNREENKHGIRGGSPDDGYSGVSSSAGYGEIGQLKLDEVTSRRLVDSYLKHIHIIHPILDPAALISSLVLPPCQRSNAKTLAMNMETPGKKRKRSLLANAIESPEVTASYHLKPRWPQRSIENAVLLLVLALGRICEHRTKVPVPDCETNLDVIPGFAYASLAMGIVGDEIGENSLHHVHANILASLYFDQLALPSYSHRFINNASLGLQVILRL